jgi:hypothetical protein
MMLRVEKQIANLPALLHGVAEEILETGLPLVEAETLYFICIGEPVHEPSVLDIAADERRTGRRRPRQLAFKF